MATAVEIFANRQKAIRRKASRRCLHELMRRLFSSPRGMDVFDLVLELNLARDKMKKGAFNIVDIYLESLEAKMKPK